MCVANLTEVEEEQVVHTPDAREVRASTNSSGGLHFKRFATRWSLWLRSVLPALWRRREILWQA